MNRSNEHKNEAVSKDENLQVDRAISKTRNQQVHLLTVDRPMVT